jgi:hypothetical protein
MIARAFGWYGKWISVKNVHFCTHLTAKVKQRCNRLVIRKKSMLGAVSRCIRISDRCLSRLHRKLLEKLFRTSAKNISERIWNKMTQCALVCGNLLTRTWCFFGFLGALLYFPQTGGLTHLSVFSVAFPDHKMRLLIIIAPGILVIWAVTNPSTNRAKHGLTLVIKWLSVCQTWQNADTRD